MHLSRTLNQCSIRRAMTICSLLFWLPGLAAASSLDQISAANSSLACTANRADNFIKYLKQDNLNATVLVAACRNVCNVALGTGNPVRSIKTC